MTFKAHFVFMLLESTDVLAFALDQVKFGILIGIMPEFTFFVLL